MPPPCEETAITFYLMTAADEVSERARMKQLALRLGWSTFGSGTVGEKHTTESVLWQQRFGSLAHGLAAVEELKSQAAPFQGMIRVDYPTVIPMPADRDAETRRLCSLIGERRGWFVKENGDRQVFSQAFSDGAAEETAVEELERRLNKVRTVAFFIDRE
jgi:hypothetical protein